MDMINLNIKSKTQEYQKEDSRKPKAKEQKASRMVPRNLKIRTNARYLKKAPREV